MRFFHVHLDQTGIGTLAALVEHMPQESALLRALHGPDVALTYADHLARWQVYELRLANWQRAGGKRGAAPEPPQTPGELLEADKGNQKNQKLVKRLREKLRRKQQADKKGTPDVV